MLTKSTTVKTNHLGNVRKRKRWHAIHESDTLPAVAFLTIREAADLTGHSTHKIRRLIKAIADQPDHADRSHIEPSAVDVARLAAQQVQFTWRVRDELVRRELGEAATVASSAAATGESPITDAVAVLQRALAAQETVTERLLEQLKAKDAQIEGQQQFMQSLNERLRESNLLMASLQKQLPGPTLPGAESPVAKDIEQQSAKPNADKGGRVKPSRHRSWWRGVFR